MSLSGSDANPAAPIIENEAAVQRRLDLAPRCRFGLHISGDCIANRESERPRVFGLLQHRRIVAAGNIQQIVDADHGISRSRIDVLLRAVAQKSRLHNSGVLS